MLPGDVSGDILAAGLVAGHKTNPASLPQGAQAAIDPATAQKLLAGDSAGGDRFGTSVSVSGSTAVIGAPQDNDRGADSGSAYVFVRSGNIWTQQQKLIANDGAAGDQFGRSVSISGDTVVVSSEYALNGDNIGSVYVFVRSGGS